METTVLRPLLSPACVPSSGEGTSFLTTQRQEGPSTSAQILRPPLSESVDPYFPGAEGHNSSSLLKRTSFLNVTA